MSSPSTKCRAKACSSNGAAAANRSASTMRNFSRRSVDCSLMTLEGNGSGRRGGFRSVSSSGIASTLLSCFAVIPVLVVVVVVAWLNTSRSCGAPAAAHQKRRERFRLADFERSLARHLQRRGEARRERRAAQVGIEQELGQQRIERRPIERHAEQPLQLAARLGQRPDAARRQPPAPTRPALPLLRVGLQQIVDIGAIDALAGDADRLRQTAGEDVAAEPFARHQVRRRFAHGVEPLEPEGKERGKLGPARLPLLRGFGRQQQLRFEESEPCRHDEIVGGDLEPEPARLGDEIEILLGERKHGDLGEIDLLGARERKQEVERPFETLDVDHEPIARFEHGFPALPVLDRVRLRRRLVRRGFDRAHALTVGSRPRLATCVPAASVTSAMASAASNGSGARNCARALAKRSAARPSRRGTAPATSIISSSLPLQWSATSQPASIVPRARSANEPPRAFMPRSSLITKPVKPIRFRITSPIITGETLDGRRSSKAGMRTWAVIARGAWRSARKGRKSTASSSDRLASMQGSARWLSAPARPWPGTCLMTGSTPPDRQPSITALPRTITVSGSVA